MTCENGTVNKILLRGCSACLENDIVVKESSNHICGIDEINSKDVYVKC